MSSHRTPMPKAGFPITLRLLDQDHGQRRILETFIRDTYARIYGARVLQFMPTLMGLRDHADRYVAALGFRRPRDGELFLEQYLDQPVEQAIAARLGVARERIPRPRVMEVGNLAGGDAGATRWLIIAFAAYLQGAGYDWAVFTAVPSLRNSFQRLGLRLFPLAEATPQRLPANEREQWGRYYDSTPEVSALNIPHTYGVLDRYLRLERAVALLKTIWQTSYSAGTRALLENTADAHPNA